MRAPLFAFSLLLLLAAPVVAALPAPAPLPAEEPVAWHQIFDFAAQRSCSSHDPALGIVSADLTSTLSHAAHDGLTTYVLRLDATPDMACPAIELTFTSSLAWSGNDAEFSYASFATGCGAAGWMTRDQRSGSSTVSLGFTSLPAECAVPFSPSTMLYFNVQPVLAGSQACLPVAFSGCTGPREDTQPTFGSDCERGTEGLWIDVAGLSVLYGTHRCEWWSGHEYGQVGDGFDVVRIRGSPGACTITLLGAVGGEQTVACPAELGDAIYEQDWHAVLP